MEEETPLYEMLAPGEVLIVSKSGDTIKYLANRDGELVAGKVSWVEPIEPEKEE